MKILVAEDDPVSLKVLRITLENHGHEVVTAVNGRLAWQQLVLQPVQVVISDWMMPEMDGLELCAKIRRRRSRNYCYFIMLTARSGRENYEKAMEVGVDDFLAKPLHADELMMRLRVAERILSFEREVGDLRRLLPICSYCKKIRDDKDYWQGIEHYFHKHAGMDFSHSICPQCYAEHVKPQLDEMEQRPEAGDSSAGK